MSSTTVYQHKKFSSKTEEYTHKKFGVQMNKRKYEQLEKEEATSPITAETILEQAAEEQQSSTKRRQTKPLFRPWMDEDSKDMSTIKITTSQPTQFQQRVLNTIPTNIVTTHQHAIMANQYPDKQRLEREQERRYRNSMACLQNRRNKQAEQLRLQQQQQYAAYHQYQALQMALSIRTGMHLRHLQQLALQRQQHQQQQLFVFGNQ